MTRLNDLLNFHDAAEAMRRAQDKETEMECRHCGKPIRQSRNGNCATTDPNDAAPWYCAADPGVDKRHAPAKEAQ